MIISKRKGLLEIKVLKHKKENKIRLADEYAKLDLNKVRIPEHKKALTRFLKIPAKFSSIFKRQKPNDYTAQEKKLLEHRNCFCGKVDNQKMIQCEECEKWLHFSCVGINSQTHANAIPSFICVNCQETKNGNHKESNGSQKQLKNKSRKNSNAVAIPIVQSDEEKQRQGTELLNQLILNIDELKTDLELKITQLKNRNGNKVGFIKDLENQKKKI